MEKKEEKETPIKVENNDAPVSIMTSHNSPHVVHRHGELSFRLRSISRGSPHNCLAALVVGFQSLALFITIFVISDLLTWRLNRLEALSLV